LLCTGTGYIFAQKASELGQDRGKTSGAALRLAADIQKLEDEEKTLRKQIEALTNPEPSLVGEDDVAEWKKQVTIMEARYKELSEKAEADRLDEEKRAMSELRKQIDAVTAKIAEAERTSGYLSADDTPESARRATKTKDATVVEAQNELAEKERESKRLKRRLQILKDGEDPP